jgi:hypothetical protein
MTGEPNVTLTIDLNSPDRNTEEADEAVQKLLSQMQDWDEIESVDRVPDPNPPAGNKAAGGWLVGLLMAEVSVANFKKLGAFLGDRLGNKPLKLKVKAPDGRELELEASSQQEFEFVYQKAQDFLKGA